MALALALFFNQVTGGPVIVQHQKLSLLGVFLQSGDSRALPIQMRFQLPPHEYKRALMFVVRSMECASNH